MDKHITRKMYTETRELTSCVSCPYFEIGMLNNTWCDWQGGNISLEGCEGVIPQWCPLEDVEARSQGMNNLPEFIGELSQAELISFIDLINTPIFRERNSLEASLLIRNLVRYVAKDKGINL